MARPNKLIQFYLTNMCNSKCNTCQIWKNRNIQELSVMKVEETIRDFPDADYVFGGGEFTLYKQRDRLLDMCDKNGVNYTVLSNAVNLKLLEQLLASHEVKNLTMSCDGIKHDEIRGVKGNLKNIECVIDYWRNSIPNIKLSYTLSKLNEANIDNDMAYFKRNGFDKIYFCIAQNMDLLNAEGDITPSKSSLEYLYESYSYMLYDKDQQLLEDFINGRHKRCDSTVDVHTIYTNGDVVRCQSILSSNVLGNINEHPLKYILEADKKWRETIPNGFVCPWNDECELVCQRRYDYEDRL